VIDGVHAEGGLMAPQLWHVGAVKGRTATWVPPCPYDSPSGLASPGGKLGEARKVHDGRSKELKSFERTALATLY
jgi:2,4-dienoyl-CoA reductase-like NADH-dependent reductase (Old Yellow Enzyme family)